MLPNSEETADLVIFTEDTLHGKLHFLCSDRKKKKKKLKIKSTD